MWFEQTLVRSIVFQSSSSRQTIPAFRSFFTASQPSARLHSLRVLDRSAPFRFRSEKSAFFQRFRSIRWKSDKPTSPKPNPTPHLGSPEPAPSLSQRLKKLSREYGWSALGVYLTLTALDFPFCFLAVRWVGTETIGHYEHAVIDACKKFIRIAFPNFRKDKESEERTLSDGAVMATAREGNVGWTSEIDQAQANNSGSGASIWTQLALAYAIHKSFIFIRVPVTAAITPRIVKFLRSRGWDIGKRKQKSG
ncbi:hypothetical protein CC78DRAFT_458832 [Lojkania enalia]|uniref:DUF1279 domain-containing protein n=1 Tax=Lojkania enalia TaxID=147567 RepID=A0A9P4KFD9_9PLEO|nr:hypothetical protein CC78DRAFT_458832 [Didymosphaeria enalia]